MFVAIISDLLYIYGGITYVSRDIQERYRTLSMYKLPVSEEELSVVDNIEEKWNDLFLQAKQVDRSLVKVKKKFTLVRE